MTQPVNDFNDGAAYENYMGRWSKLVGRQFLTWLDAPPQSKWIDVGCGNGAFTDEILAISKPASVTGIDPSEGQIQFARQRHSSAEAEYRVGDAQELPFANNSFDIATMALVIAFVPAPAKALAELGRVTRPGGLVATYMWDLPTGIPGSPLIEAMSDMGVPRSLPPSADFSQMEPMRKLWIDAGLQSVESKQIRIKVSFSNFDEFKQWSMMPSGPLSKSILSLSAAARDELYSRLSKTLPVAADGSITYESFANAVKGKVPPKV